MTPPRPQDGPPRPRPAVLVDAPRARSLSIVIPTLDEGEHLGALLGDLLAIRDVMGSGCEVVVSDGGSTDDTVAIARASGARVVAGPRGRGRQLAAGARVASGQVLAFLHADVRADRAALSALSWATSFGDPDTAWWFPLQIDAPGAAYRAVERGTWLRSRVLGLPYGDQGLVLGRPLYERAGGYAPVPLMEDVMLARAVKRVGRLRGLAQPLRVSARRWRRDGVVGRTLGNWGMLLAFLAGASPERLAERYERRRGRA